MGCVLFTVFTQLWNGIPAVVLILHHLHDETAEESSIQCPLNEVRCVDGLALGACKSHAVQMGDCMHHKRDFLTLNGPTAGDAV